METGEVIKKLRNEKKFTQSELGIMLGVNTSSIQKYESGATKNLKLETIQELCHIFEVPPIIFVFPEIYCNSYNKKFKDYDLLPYIFTELLDITKEGSEKIMDYIEDIRSIQKYKKD